MDTRTLFVAALAIPLAGCLLTPDGLDAERERSDAAGAAWTAPHVERELPPLPTSPAPADLLKRAFLANGELEADWHAWRAALSNVEVESAWPEGTFDLEIERAFSTGESAFDSTLVTLGFEPMLMLPSKVSARARVALAEARAAGERFRMRALDLRAEVVAAAWRVAELSSVERLRAEDAELLRIQLNCCGQALTDESAQRDFLRLSLEAELSVDAHARTKAELERARADLDALLARRGEPPFELDLAALPVRPLASTDDELYTLAARHNPEIAELARDVEGREDALELARLAYLPDVSPRVGFLGSMEQFLGASFLIPSNLPAIRAGIEQARSGLEATRARVRQRHHDVGARLTGELILLRDADRAVDLFTKEVVPVAQRLSDSARIGYELGSIPQREWVEARRMVVDSRRMLIEARASREVALARIEALTGLGLADTAIVAEVHHE